VNANGSKGGGQGEQPSDSKTRAAKHCAKVSSRNSNLGRESHMAAVNFCILTII